MSYCLATLWHDRQRFLPAVFAVAFSAVLVALQCGLVWGALSVVSTPIDHTHADLWLAAPDVATVDMGQAIPRRWAARLDLPQVERWEPFLQGFAFWHKPSGGSERCVILGSRLDPTALGAADELTPTLRARLTEPGSVVIDDDDCQRLGLTHGVGETAEVNGKRVRVVGTVHGIKGLGGAYLFCSTDTARSLLKLSPCQTVFLLARCRHQADAPAVARQLRRYSDMTAFTRDDFSLKTRCHWLFNTGAGVLVGLAAALGLLVGAVITSQTLYAATAASIRELAVLRALGIPRWRMAAQVVGQSLGVGLVGLLVSLPLIFGLGHIAELLGAKMYLGDRLLTATAAGSLVMVLVSGLTSLRSLRLAEPAALLR